MAQSNTQVTAKFCSRRRCFLRDALGRDETQLMRVPLSRVALLKATLLKEQRDVFEADIGELYASMMAMVHDVSVTA